MDSLIFELQVSFIFNYFCPQMYAIYLNMKYKIFLGVREKKEKQTVNHFIHRPRMNNWKC